MDAFVSAHELTNFFLSLRSWQFCFGERSSGCVARSCARQQNRQVRTRSINLEKLGQRFQCYFETRSLPMIARIFNVGDGCLCLLSNNVFERRPSTWGRLFESLVSGFAPGGGGEDSTDERDGDARRLA